MCSSIFTPSYWADKGHPEAWTTLISGLLTATATLLAVGVAAYLTHYYTRKHSKATHNTAINMDHLKRDIDALEKIWELLAYMTLAESEHAILRWRQEKGQTEKEYFIHVGNLKVFILQKTSQIFYKDHAGLHMPKHIREQFFDYKGSLMGLYIKYECDKNVTDDSLIKLKNKHLIDKLCSAYDDLNKGLKEELELRYEQLVLSH